MPPLGKGTNTTLLLVVLFWDDFSSLWPLLIWCEEGDEWAVARFMRFDGIRSFEFRRPFVLLVDANKETRVWGVWVVRVCEKMMPFGKVFAWNMQNVLFLDVFNQATLNTSRPHPTPTSHQKTFLYYHCKLTWALRRRLALCTCGRPRSSAFTCKRCRWFGPRGRKTCTCRIWSLIKPLKYNKRLIYNYIKGVVAKIHFLLGIFKVWLIENI